MNGRQEQIHKKQMMSGCVDIALQPLQGQR